MTLTTAGPASTHQNTRPFHCGEAMSAVSQSDLSGPAAGYTTWRCFCGFQQDGPAAGERTLPEHRGARTDHTRLVAAMSRVERLRWELDIATFDLRVAVEDAIQRGASPADIAVAIDLGPDEVHQLVAR